MFFSTYGSHDMPWLKWKIGDEGTVHSGWAPCQWSWTPCIVKLVLRMAAIRLYEIWGGGMLCAENWRWVDGVPLRPIIL